jgi:hypothetical protein
VPLPGALDRIELRLVPRDPLPGVRAIETASMLRSWQMPSRLQFMFRRTRSSGLTPTSLR